MRRLWAVMVIERHSDPDVELFARKEDALTRARQVVREYARGRAIDEPDGFHGQGEGGWHYYGGWGTEGDYVFVVEREVGL